ncbi:hypothetical protein Tco_0497664 [Tanacetum coccineum]
MDVKTPYEKLKDNEKKQLGKNNEAKMTLYNALPRKEYERVFRFKATKKIWHTLIITHQGDGVVVCVPVGGSFMNREPLSKDILGATTQRDTGSYYPKRYWELIPKEILGATTQRDKEILVAITQRDTRSYYPKRYWDVLWENGEYKLMEQDLRLTLAKMGRNGVFGFVRLVTTSRLRFSSFLASILSLGTSLDLLLLLWKARIPFEAEVTKEGKYEDKYFSKKVMEVVSRLLGDVMGASSTQRKVSMVPFVFSIPFVLRWGGSISSDSFLPSIMLLVVIIVTVVIVVVILIVIVVVIVGVVIVVAIIGVVVIVDGVSSILKFSFVIIGFLRRIVFYYLLHQPLGYGNGFLQSLRF